MRAERLKDVVVVVLSLTVAAGFLKAFADDLGATTARAGEKPVGTIIFKRKTAQRRYSDRAVWESLERSAPVYGMDALRTDEDAEALVRLDDGTEINLQENSLVVLAFAANERRLEFVSGSITAVGSETSDLRISTEKSEVTVAGSTADLRKDAAGSVSLASLAGTVQVATKGEAARSIGRSEEATITSAGTTVAAVATSLLSPANGARFAAWALPASVPFSWQGPDGEAVLEISRSVDFREPVAAVRSATGEAGAEIGEGAWYWRVRGADGSASRANSLRVFSASSAEPLSPAEGAVLSFRSVPLRVRLEWSIPADASDAVWELARDEGFTQVEFSGDSEGSSITAGPLPAGSWYWRVTARFPGIQVGSPIAKARSFVVDRLASLPAPLPISPVADRTILGEQLEGSGFPLVWTSVRDAVSYSVELSSDGDFARPLRTLQASVASANLPGGLAPGGYRWRVIAQDGSGERSPPSEIASFRISETFSPIELDSPADGFSLAGGSGRLFVWRGTAGASWLFRIEEKDTGRIVHENALTGISSPLPKLAPGAYLWSVAPAAAPERRVSRSFSVLGPLRAPTALAPADGASFSLVNAKDLAFSWQVAPETDAYRIVLREGGGAVIAEAETAETVWTYSGPLSTGRYRWTLQAIRRARDGAEAQLSAESGFSFNLRSVRTVGSASPASPAEGALFAGLEARDPGVRFRFKAAESGARTTLLVSDASDFPASSVRVEAKGENATVPLLVPGRYYWKLLSRSSEGVELPESAIRAFSVARIPPLPAPSILSPRPGETVDMRGRDALPLSWTKVQGANTYQARLVEESSGMLVWSADRLASAEAVIDDIERLDVGTFVLSVAADFLDGKGESIRGGTAARSRFTLSLGPVPAAPVIVTPRRIYVP